MNTSSELLDSTDPQALKNWRTGRRVELIARRIAASAADHDRRSLAIDGHVASLLTDVAGNIIGFCGPYQAEYDARAMVLDWLERGARGALPVVIAARTPLIFRKCGTWKQRWFRVRTTFPSELVLRKSSRTLFWFR
jgi:5-formyltetrahydrofolate cyclo-ligase